jgi:hypothetical protein
MEFRKGSEKSWLKFAFSTEHATRAIADSQIYRGRARLSLVCGQTF